VLALGSATRNINVEPTEAAIPNHALRSRRFFIKYLDGDPLQRNSGAHGVQRVVAMQREELAANSFSSGNSLYEVT
jgi:hypothetical protein